MSIPSVSRIGYWWSEKKSRKFNVEEFSNVCRAHEFELVKINLNHPLEDQGPFVAIVVKLTDFIINAEKGDIDSKSVCEMFQGYVDNHPEVIVIDPLPNIKKLANRYTQYQCVVSELNKKEDVFIPAFVELSTTNISENMAKMKAAGVDFPIVCKPSLAHGLTAHQMCLIFNEEGLKDVSPPCVAQKFINHNAVLYKLFTIGDKYFMIERPSLKNFCAGDQQTIFFNSHNVSKPNSASELTELDENDEQQTPYLWPEKEKMDYIVKTLCKCLGLSLLGIDVIIDNRTGYYGVVDINVFPGYGEVDSFFQLLCELIEEKISLKVAGKDEPECKPKLNQCVLTPRGQQKFCFDLANGADGQSKIVIPNIPSYLCNPSLSASLSGSCPERKHLKICLGEQHFHSQDCAQDDSGIETSDSCDEKKEPCHRTMKRVHSRLANSVTVSVDDISS